jgi:hypothetical protein
MLLVVWYFFKIYIDDWIIIHDIHGQRDLFWKTNLNLLKKISLEKLFNSEINLTKSIIYR